MRKPSMLRMSEAVQDTAEHLETGDGLQVSAA